MPLPLGVVAGIGALGSAAAGFFSGRGQAAANRQNIALAREQMSFQERMSGTAYQRAMKDMRMAGLNPMLAYQQGGASTPGGAKAEVASTAAPAVSSALAVSRITADIAAIKAGILKTRAETDAIRGRPGRVLEPVVDVGVDLARGLMTGTPEFLAPGGHVMPPGYPSMSELIRATSARAVKGFKEVAATIGRIIRPPRR